MKFFSEDVGIQQDNYYLTGVGVSIFIVSNSESEHVIITLQLAIERREEENCIKEDM